MTRILNVRDEMPAYVRVLLSALLGACAGAIAPAPAHGTDPSHHHGGPVNAPKVTVSPSTPGEVAAPHATTPATGSNAGEGAGSDFTVADATKSVNEGALSQHVGNRIVNYDVPTRLVQTRCGKDALATVALWERIVHTQGLDPKCIRARPGWIACIALGHGAGVTVALGLLFRASDGRLVGGLIDSETGLTRPLKEMLSNVDELYKQMDEPTPCP